MSEMINRTAVISGAFVFAVVGLFFVSKSVIPQSTPAIANTAQTTNASVGAGTHSDLSLPTNTGAPQRSVQYFNDCIKSGPNGEYTDADFLRDARGTTKIELDWVTKILSMMNCGQSFNRYTIDDFMCDPRFKGSSWWDKLRLARNLSVSTCGWLPVNSMPVEPRRPKMIMDMGGGLIMELPD